MQKKEMEALSFDELWRLHDQIAKILTGRMVAEKLELERRLAQISGKDTLIRKASRKLSPVSDNSPRRKYPRVFPKYRNPSLPLETWSGRGKTPRWLVAALKNGHKIDEFRIVNTVKRIK